MSAEVSVAVIGAVAVITASIIGLIVAVATAVISKEQKVSEFRQAWINELRNDIALTLRYAYTYCFLSQSYLMLKTEKEQVTSTISMNEVFSDLELKTISIKLKLNPTKDIKFIELVTTTLYLVENIDHLNRRTINERFDEASTSLRLLEAEAHRILKQEWEVVKNGDKRFINFKRLGKYLAGALIVAFYVLLILVKFPEYFPGVQTIAIAAESLRSVT